MMHGVSSDSLMWLLNDFEKAPAFMLANQGYDIWLGNNRGTKVSQRHKYLYNSDKRFWDFSFEEMGTKDVPAFVDFILDKTNRTSIDGYVAHSCGTT